MINSMTGYGKCQKIVEGKDVLVEIKSVNHRYLDLNIKMPRHLSFAEDRIRKLLSGKLQRGKVDIYISLTAREESGKKVLLDEGLAASYIDALKSLASSYGLTDDVSVSVVAKNDEIFKVERPMEDEEEIFGIVLPVFEQAFSEFTAMRQREGDRLNKDLLFKKKQITELINKIKEIVPCTVLAYKDKLLKRIKDLIDDVQIDEGRILTEAAVYADKSCVDEEIVRLYSHMEEFKHILDGGGAIGRKLDFLIQEMNREANTIGSKANELEISRLVIDLKTEIEKLREQVQNIE